MTEGISQNKHIHGHRILFPLTQEQKAIYKAFGVQELV